MTGANDRRWSFPALIGAGRRRGTAPRRRRSRSSGVARRLRHPFGPREREDDGESAEGGRRVPDAARGAGERIRPARTAADEHPAGDSRRGDPSGAVGPPGAVGRGPASATGTRPGRPPLTAPSGDSGGNATADRPGGSGAPTLPGGEVGSDPAAFPARTSGNPGTGGRSTPGEARPEQPRSGSDHPGPSARSEEAARPAKGVRPGDLPRFRGPLPAATKASGTCLGTSGFAGRERGGAADRRVGPCPRWASRPRKESPVVAPVFRGPSGTRCRRRGGRWSPAVPCSVAQVRVSRIGTKILLSRIPGAFLPRSAGGPPAGSGAVALPAGGWRAYALSGPRTG